MTDRSDIKKQLRRQVLSERDALDPGIKREYDARILENVLAVISGKNPRRVCSYVSFRSEADTFSIIGALFQNGIRVSVPLVKGDRIVFYDIASFDDLRPGYMGIPEPVEKCPEAVIRPEETIILVPGSVFDRNGRRYGYGGGFYDRFLAGNRGLFSIGLAYSLQIRDSLDTDDWDIALDMLIDETGITRCGKV